MCASPRSIEIVWQLTVLLRKLLNTSDDNGELNSASSAVEAFVSCPAFVSVGQF